MTNISGPLVDGSVAWNNSREGCYRSTSHLEGFHHCEDFGVMEADNVQIEEVKLS